MPQFKAQQNLEKHTKGFEFSENIAPVQVTALSQFQTQQNLRKNTQELRFSANTVPAWVTTSF